ncbi:hypothetical protein CF386_09710 [Paraphotobacterium marinum]|uniref:Flavodoxin-like fold domain-containing protein n=1 Tax=Paraphotobacterium marinum TaxID=1755811 RepID=A0A220VGM9_9GAMM|nr:NAD(P)H-dependent oxidoreductase [Paraphotobacterium marinum]ASK79332.1 hypothetical protein CF386_09710 [Paraphotobacterium marinum]
MTKNILVISFHPNLSESHANITIINSFRKIENVNFSIVSDIDLDDKESINLIKKELLTYNDIILLFPFYWYSAPYLLQKWFEKVLTKDFAYSTNFLLKNKKFNLIVTAGGSEQDFSSTGKNKYSVEYFLCPIYSTIEYIKAKHTGTHVLYNAHGLTQEKVDDIIKDIIL